MLMTLDSLFSSLVPFILVHARKYRTKDRLKIQTIYEINETYKKQTMQNAAEQNYPWFTRLSSHSARKQGGLFYNAYKPTWGETT